jgi:hypothetical protein
MEKLFEFNSRYGQPRLVYRNGPFEYLIEGESSFIRVGEEFIDFEGGPFISTDSSLEEQLGIPDKRKISSLKVEEGESPYYYRMRIKMDS